MGLICPNCKNGLMKWKIKNKVMICENCNYEGSINIWEKDWSEKYSQNLAKPDAYSLLAEMRSIILEEICLYDNEEIKKDNSMISKSFKAGYNSALKDVLIKISEHFS